jgi:plasmid stability protein
MSSLQIRDIPETTHRVLKQRAAAAGQSLSEYALGQLTMLTDRPTIAELSSRIEANSTPAPTTPAADILRAERDSRS